MCICVICKCLRFGTLDLQQDLASQVEESLVKTPAREALRSVPSHVAEVNVNQSAFGQRPRWTHSPHANNALATQLYKNQRSLTDKEITSQCNKYDCVRK
jgi:hypothetical protein